MSDTLKLGPGMVSNRRCKCGALLRVEDTERCADCLPRLSKIARAAENARRKHHEYITALEQESDQLETTIRNVERGVRKWSRLQRIRSSGTRPTSD
jgi:hypothetical protein